MEALLINRKDLPEPLLSIDDYIDPDDYDNETDFLNAIPGMREKIINGLNTPLEDCADVPDDWIKRNV
jgi:hypothetical protein